MDDLGSLAVPIRLKGEFDFRPICLNQKDRIFEFSPFQIRTLRSNSLPHIVETYRLEFHRRKKSQAQVGALPTLPPPTPSPTERQTRDFEEEKDYQSNRGKMTEERSAQNQKM